jgi:hypothetical protein
VNRASSPSLKGRTAAETRRAVLDLIRGSNAMSRADPARQSELAEATIARIVRDLQADAVVRPIGHAASTGGKRPTLIALNQTSTYALGGRPRQLSSVVVLSALDMAPSSPADRRFYRPPTLYPAQILDHVAAMIAGLLTDQTSIRAPSRVSASPARPGPRFAWLERGQCHLRSLRGVRRRPLPGPPHRSAGHGRERRDLRHARHLLTFGQTSRSLLTVYMAYGIGASLVLHGHLCRGASGNAGEIGHRTVQPGPAPLLVWIARLPGSRCLAPRDGSLHRCGPRAPQRPPDR